MIKRVAVFWTTVFLTFVSATGFCPHSNALTILQQPTFSPSASAPLAGLLKLTTDVASRVSILVDDGTNSRENNFYDFATNHAVTLLGFKPARTNLIQVTVYDKNRNAETATPLLAFVTAPLPSSFPASIVLTNKPDEMEPGYTLFMIQNRTASKNYIVIMNNEGEVVWYCTAPAFNDSDVRQLDDGNLFINDYIGKRFLEMNMLGATVKTWNAPAGYPINVHDGFPTDRGTILYLSDVTRIVTNFPSSDTVSNSAAVTINDDDNMVVEISATNAALLHTWSLLDILQDPTRVTYLTYGPGSAVPNVDNEHANALIEDPSDDSIIVSLRTQNAVFKFSRDTGKLKWVLGPPANWNSNVQPYLFTPVGSPFQWNYGQHAPMLTPQGTVMLYDDGNFRASPFDTSVPDQNNYSRAVEYSLDETNMQITQVWDTAAAESDTLFTPIIGKAQWLPQKQNVLVTYGYVSYINGVHPSAHSANATMVRVKEYTHEAIPQVVFDLSFFDYTNTSASYLGYFLYRATRIPDLYAHPLLPVTDLSVMDASTTPRLVFSGDPSLSYMVEASTDLVNWESAGTAAPGETAGEFNFTDFEADQFAIRFYRVVTQNGL